MAQLTPVPPLSRGPKTQATMLQRLRDASDPLAWNEFFRRYWRLIYALAKRRGCSDHTAEEIVQDVMLKVFEQKDLFDYDPSRGRFRDWLATLVRNRVTDYHREPSQRVRARGGDSGLKEVGSEANQPGPEALCEAAFDEALLWVLLDIVRCEMNPRAYLAFVLRSLYDLPGAKVAAFTGLTRNAVYRAQRRALRRLRQLGATYHQEGQFGELLKQALRSRPKAAVERSLTTRIEKTMRSR